MANATQQGDFLMAKLKNCKPSSGDRRRARRGLMIGVELVEPDGSPAPDAAERVVQSCFRKGLLLLPVARVPSGSVRRS